MLTLTETAGTVVSELVARVSPIETAGMRIQQGEDRFNLAVAEAPDVAEIVVERGDARVFLDGQLAAILDEMTLDAVIEETGDVRFALKPQGVSQG
ncbi:MULTISPECIES: Fe-S cluster assembly protein HesB [unclassified Salinibacterium]|uniref:Fe-S cluster assembly protein HesB n=1 Tax=unclassified Salinibacterium TaxID=2632331 RepID=UPI001422EE47|nr:MULTISPECIES: Fe-S cluster assembly protein HesB [unclassified Salinibacterium]